VSANLDLVRSIYADLGRGFVFQAALERTHPEFEMIIADGPRAGSFKGLAGAAESFYGMLEAWDEWRFEAEEYRELDDERVLVLDHRTGRGKWSGVKVETKAAAVYHMRDGKLTRIIIYWDRDRGLADLGLEEQAMPEESTTPDLEETLRRSIEAFSRRDLDAALSVYVPNAVWDWSRVGLGVYEGSEAIRGVFEDWWDSYEDIEQVVEEFRDLGSGVTFGVVEMRGRPTGSSGLVGVRYGALGAWVDGLVQKVTVYADLDEARAAAERLAEERR
jgi:ketosteroid isomerase-like protein